ncbi:MAG: MATE family efflux transporter [Polyangiales bacterium]
MSASQVQPATTIDVFAPQTKRILQGPLSWEVLRFGAPIAFGMAFQVTFNLVDAYLIARLPEGRAGPAIGAVGICDQIAAMGTIVSYGLSTATAAILSQRKGAGDLDAVRRSGWQSLLLTLGLSIAFGLFGSLFAKPILYQVVGAKGEVARMGVEYLRVIVGGSFSIFFLLQLTSMMRALGSAKTPVAILIFGNILNLFLAILLVYGQGERPPIFAWSLPIAVAVHAPRMELVGAAWATIFARSAALIPAFFYLASRRGDRILRPRKEWRAPIWSELRAIWTIGWPSSTQFVVRIGAILVTSALIAHAFTTESDQTASTAFGIVFRVETMALFISMGWGSAAQTFVGTCVGASNPRRAGLAGWWAAGYDALAMGLLALFVSIWGGALLNFFDHDPKVIHIGVEYLAVVAPSYVTYGAAIVLGNAFSGASATRTTLKLDLVIVCCVQVPLSFVLVILMHQSRHSLWAAVATTNAVSALVYGIAYARSRLFWRRSPSGPEADTFEHPKDPPRGKVARLPAD